MLRKQIIILQTGIAFEFIFSLKRNQKEENRVKLINHPIAFKQFRFIQKLLSNHTVTWVGIFSFTPLLVDLEKLDREGLDLEAKEKETHNKKCYPADQFTHA